MEAKDNVIILGPGESMHDYKGKKKVVKPAVVTPAVEKPVNPVNQKKK